MRSLRKLLGISPDVHPVPRRNLVRWLKRKSKYYNPAGICQICTRPISKHAQLCPGCIEEIRWWEAEEKSYQDTINSIRADWHR